MAANNSIFWRATIARRNANNPNFMGASDQSINGNIQPEDHPSHMPDAALGHANNLYHQQGDPALLFHPTPAVTPAGEANHGANFVGTQNLEQQQLEARLAQLEAEAKSIRERLLNFHYSTPDPQPNLASAPAVAADESTVITSLSDLSTYFSAETIFNPAARECGFPRSFDGMARAVKRLQDAIKDCTDIIDNDEKKEGRRQTRIGLSKQKTEEMTAKQRELMSWELLFRARDAQAECLVSRSHYSKSPKIVHYPSFEARWDRVIHYLKHCKAAVKNLTALDRVDRVVAGPDVELKQRHRNNKGNSKKGDDLAKVKGKANVVAGNAEASDDGNIEANDGGNDEANDGEGADCNVVADDANQGNDDNAMTNGHGVNPINPINPNVVHANFKPGNHHRIANGAESVNAEDVINESHPIHGSPVVNEVGAAYAGMAVNQSDRLNPHMLNDVGSGLSDGNMMANNVIDNGAHVDYNPMANDMIDAAELLALLGGMEADADNDNMMVNHGDANEGNLMANHGAAVQDNWVANNIDMGNDNTMVQGPGKRPYEMSPPNWGHNAAENPDAGFYQYRHEGRLAPGLRRGAANPCLKAGEEDVLFQFHPSTSYGRARTASNAWGA
ncbi:hypothetical protein QBC40DRAFT_249424 [Triangularia verruculosa]|uniref:Uncharacterized protein n=1 Tax=Triangularia verruculosa TaxID=2587418 RepID=A0AAN6XR19_9PEZI|nr:hypothetical protein QBC40DRAFT_249424 [Triangularia verruculosa]